MRHLSNGLVWLTMAVTFTVVIAIEPAFAEEFKIIKDASSGMKTVIVGPLKYVVEGAMALGGAAGYFHTKSIMPLVTGAFGIGILEFILSRLA